ncbi:MAG TPA: hypothetical protein P5205_18090 [Candidatus Paceibacterota bacterium]|nr:hypothetical protein [Verrucomicrobiota bacterium]HSA12274.1 hypothetical protein [Candidatus Paceibacterota bacterium]
MTEKPLFNLGEVMPDGILNTEHVPDLSGKTKVVGHTSKHTLVGPTKVTQAHKVVFLLAKCGASLHREEVAHRAEIPIASIGYVLAKLTQERVLICPEWGYYALSKDFLRQFQYAFGTPKTETLFKMLEEGGVDVARFEFPLNEKSSATAKPSMLGAIKTYVEGQRERIVAIGLEIQRLTEEKTAVEGELASIGQMTASKPENPVQEAA